MQITFSMTVWMKQGNTLHHNWMLSISIFHLNLDIKEQSIQNKREENATAAKYMLKHMKCVSLRSIHALLCGPKRQYYPVIFRCQWVQDGELLCLACDSVSFLDHELSLEPLFSFSWILWDFGWYPFCFALRNWRNCSPDTLVKLRKLSRLTIQWKITRSGIFMVAIFNLKTVSK